MKLRHSLRAGTARVALAALGLATAACLGAPARAQRPEGAAQAQHDIERLQQGAVPQHPSTTEGQPGAAQAGAQGEAQAGALTPGWEDFAHAAEDPANWILPHKSYSANNYTTADQVTPQNVGQLRRAWVTQLDDDGPMENSPIIWHGTMYVTSAHDHVYALDAATGKVKWEYKMAPHVISFAANRGIGLLDGKVFFGTLDGHLIALDAATGRVVWNIVPVHDQANSFYTMAPVPYRDPASGREMLLLGVSDGDWGGIGYITAFDPRDGKRIWEWETIPGPGEPGHETWSGDSWKRGGASAWGGATIDPRTRTLYLDLGNPGPDFLGTVRQGANLYTNSMVALDISGPQPRLKWHFQMIPHDTHDWDPGMQPVLFEGKLGKEPRLMVAAGDKGGNFWVLDAESGKLLNHTAASFQKGHNTEPDLAGDVACPNTLGGIEYQGGSFDPATNTFYIPSQNECGIWTATKDVIYIAGQFYLGGSFPKLVGPNTGQMNAIDVNTGIFNWRHHFDLPIYGGALLTKTGLIFSGELKGIEHAFDPKTGRILWSFDTGSNIQAPTEAYEVGGKEYVVVVSGEPGNAQIPELPNKAGQGSIVTAWTLP